MKTLKFIGTAREAVRAFPEPARREAGFQLYQVQRGLDPDDWRPMPSIGPGGVREIRLHETGEFRVVYIAQWVETI